LNFLRLSSVIAKKFKVLLHGMYNYLHIFSTLFYYIFLFLSTIKYENGPQSSKLGKILQKRTKKPIKIPYLGNRTLSGLLLRHLGPGMERLDNL